MTTDFIKAVDNIYWPLGGYSGISSVISESEMADAITFNGPTWYASSLYTADGPYYIYDLTDLGYTAGQLYRVYDHKFKFLYSARATKQPDTDQVLFGYLPEDITFLENTTHGSRYFFLFDSATGPQLSQFLVDHTADPLITQEYLTDIIRKNAITQARSSLNEAFVSYPGTFNLYTLQGTIGAVDTLESITEHPNTVSLLGISISSYFQPKHDTWLVATTTEGAPLYFADIIGLDNWINKTVLDDNGFQLLFIEARPKTYNTPISRMISGLGSPLATNFSSAKVNLQISLTTTAPV